jgi:hypothetical protein
VAWCSHLSPGKPFLYTWQSAALDIVDLTAGSGMGDSIFLIVCTVILRSNDVSSFGL